ncbi:Acyl-coenzyme A:6-aminopenicillanic acid acyl-transferase precursor [Bosea sp. LC85]|uniref:C45 family autoproteolytic acyltransferase/hydolase n=1 Tax=Bosea sp. LC85 TaxID=1502851 RepID=UPI0004E42FE9|nr:Acyl-coenzyme A:6-aminopenicillanic acid acyl-transferase precursor [Bosea sp. LC85]
MTTSPFPFVSVSGAPRERGRQYGEAARERVRRSVGLYGDQLAEFGYPAAAQSELIMAFAGEIEAFGAHYIDEMRGIAEGAGVTLEDIVMINARTEVIAKARIERSRPQREQDEADDGCSGLVVMPERSLSGRLIHAQNWDWRAECAETAIVLRVRPDDGPDFLTFVEAGGLARSGMNAAGLAITANYLDSDRDYRQQGVPLALIRRKVLEQTHLAFAIRAVATTQKTCSNNMILSSAEGFAVNYECAPDEAFAVYPSDGLIVHANHWVSPIALGKLRDTGLVNVPDSVYRDWRVRRLLEQGGGTLSAAEVKAALFDDFATPYSVCRPPRPGLRDAHLSATVAMVVMEPASGVMEVAALPALDRRFTQYSLADEPKMLAA